MRKKVWPKVEAGLLGKEVEKVKVRDLAVTRKVYELNRGAEQVLLAYLTAGEKELAEVFALLRRERRLDLPQH